MLKSKLPLSEFLRLIEANTTSLRDRLRETAPAFRQTLEEAWRLDGDVFVEDAGTTVNVFRGRTEFFYLPGILPMRDVFLDETMTGRVTLFESIAEQLEEASRVLVIGAGGDTAPLQVFSEHGHETIATEHSRDTLAKLLERIRVPGFSADLTHLDEVLPEPVDYHFGNSTLGYLDPSKAERVIRNLAATTHEGGVFTFDMTPHPYYFMIAEDTQQSTLANESASNPRRLLRYIARYGPSRGIAAMTLYSLHRGLAVNAATLTVLARQFAAFGYEAHTGYSDISATNGSLLQVLTLRVSRNRGASILCPVQGEASYSAPEELLRRPVDRPFSPLLFIDRATGKALAEALGLTASLREAPWIVAEHFARHRASPDDLAAVEADVLDELDTNAFAERITAAIKAGRYEPPATIERHILQDQIIHKQTMTGELPIDKEAADARIDALYTLARSHREAESTRLIEKKRAAKEKAKRKTQRASRKRKRR